MPNKKNENQDFKADKYQNYIQQYISKIQDNQDFLKKISENIDTGKKVEKKNQLILRPLNTIVIWVNKSIPNLDNQTIKPIFKFPKPEKLPEKNLLKENEVEVLLDSELDSNNLEDLPSFLNKKNRKKDENENLYKFFQEQKKSISVDQEKIDRIKEKLTSEQVFQEGGKTSFWQSVFATFASDFFWQSIAITMIVALLMFYFQGLQPALIRAYSQQARDGLVNINNSFNQQINIFNDMQNLVYSRFEYDSSLLCKDVSTYNFFLDDSNKLKSQRNSLNPNPNLKKLARVGPFFSQDILNIYSNKYELYQKKSQQILDKSEKLDVFLGFLDYRNSWIKACQNMQENRFSPISREESCQDLSVATQVFAQQNTDGLSADLQQKVQNGLEICFTENGNFENDWFIKYDAIMEYSPNFDQLNKEVLLLSESLSLELEKAESEIIKVETNKTSILGMFYILDF